MTHPTPSPHRTDIVDSVIRRLWPLAMMVFTVSGALKLVDPQGQPPDWLGTIDSTLYGALLRSIGALEVGLGWLVSVKRWRSRALAALGVLTVFFLAVVALSANDESFIANCGCFGRASSRSGLLASDSAGKLTLRTGAILTLLAAAWSGTSNDARRGRTRLVSSVLAATTLGAISLAVGGHLRSLEFRRNSIRRSNFGSRPLRRQKSSVSACSR